MDRRRRSRGRRPPVPPPQPGKRRRRRGRRHPPVPPLPRRPPGRFHRLRHHLPRPAPQDRYRPPAPQHAAENYRLDQGVVGEEADRELHGVTPHEQPIAGVRIPRDCEGLRDIPRRRARAVCERHGDPPDFRRLPRDRDARRRRHRRDHDEDGEVPAEVGAAPPAPPAGGAASAAGAADREDPDEAIEQGVRGAPHRHERERPARQRQLTLPRGAPGHGQHLLSRILPGGDEVKVYAVRYRHAEAERSEQYQQSTADPEGVQSVVEAYAEDRVVVEHVLEVIPPGAVPRQVVRPRRQLLGDDLVGRRRHGRRC
jgi:hypothetical protein